MAFLRYLKLIPKHLLAALLGMIFLPLRALVFATAVSLGILILSGLSIILLPFFMANEVSQGNLSLTAKVILYLIISPLLLTVLTVALSCLMVILAVMTCVDMIKSGLNGIIAGLKGGLTAMWHAYEHQLPYFERLVDRIISALNGAEPGVTDKFLASLEEKNPPIEGQELNEELLTGQSLLLQFSLLPKSDQIKRQLERLKNALERYKELSSRLQKVKDALITKDLSEIEDELTYMPVTQPILLEKQYCQDETWHTVPVSSYISDKESIFNWFRQQATHPRTRDLIKNPSHYKGPLTRYRWHELKANACYSQELVEAGEKIRELTTDLQEELAKVAPVKIARHNSHNEFKSKNESWQNRPRSNSLTSLSIFPREGKIDFKDSELGIVHNSKSGSPT